MRGLEDSVPAEIVDVAAGRNADAADLRGQRVGEIIAVEVQRGDDVKVRRARQDLLQGDVGNGVLDEGGPRRAGLPGFCTTVRRPVPLRRTRAGRVRNPSRGTPLGVFHDVPLMDEGEALALLGNGKFDSRPDEPLGTRLGDRLDADANGAGLGPEADFLILLGEIRLEEFERLDRLFGAGLEVNAGVNVLRILAENDDVDFFRDASPGRHALEILHGPQAHVKVQQLAQGDIQRPDAAPTGVVSGPLMPTRNSLKASTVSSGSQLSNLFLDVSPRHRLQTRPPLRFPP